MNGQRYLTLVVALCCVTAAGISATTFESSLDTDPDDVIDFEYDKLPIGKDDISATKREAHQNQHGGERDTGGGGGGSSSGTGNADIPPTCSGSFLVGSLGTVLPFVTPCTSVFYLLGMLLPFLLLLAVLGLAYRYRYRLVAPGLAVAGWLVEWRPFAGGAGPSSWPREPPANDVHRAWLAMVNRANIDRPWARTPAECARGAVEAGLDSEAVATLTNLFEEVRYGNAPVTDERRRRARAWRQRLDTGRDQHLADGGDQPGSRP